MDLVEIKSRECVGDEEIVLKALHPPFYDHELNRVSKSAFTKNNTSVCRKHVLPVADILGILIDQLEKPERRIAAYACLDVEEIKKASHDSDSVWLVVTVDPTPANASHAEIIAFSDESKSEIRKSVPAGVAKKLCAKLRIHHI